MTRLSFPLLALILACGTRPPVPVRPVVQYPVTSRGFALGSSDAKVIILEFGSFGCRYCKEFHDSILPRLESDPLAPVRFKFIAVDTTEPFARIALWAQCVAPKVGAKVALDSVFGIVGRAVGKGDYSDTTTLIPSGSNACSPPDSIGYIEEARRASAFGIHAMPTFIVGVEEDGYVRGWFVEGIKTELLMNTVDSVRQRIARR